MKRSVKVFFGMFAATLILSLGVVIGANNVISVEAFINNTLKVTFNGDLFSPKEDDGTPIKPIIYNGRTYLPVRAVADLVGIDVDWDSATNTVVLTSGENKNEGLPYKDGKDYNSGSTTTPTTPTVPTTPTQPTTNVPAGTSTIDEYNKINIGDTMEQVKSKLGSLGKNTYDGEYIKSYELDINQGKNVKLYIKFGKEYNETTLKLESKEIYLSMYDNKGLFTNDATDLSGAKALTDKVEAGNVTYDQVVKEFKTAGVQIELRKNYDGTFDTEYAWSDKKGGYITASFDGNKRCTSMFGYIY